MISECAKCHRQFRDDDRSGVCPCGFENTYDDDEHDEHLRRVTW